MPSLRLTAAGYPATVFHLYKKITSIGSGPDNDVVLPDPLIGDAYASIHFDGQTYTITTLQRKAEVVVNGKKRGKHKLSHDDKLVIGSCELPALEVPFCQTLSVVVADRRLGGPPDDDERQGYLSLRRLHMLQGLQLLDVLLVGDDAVQSLAIACDPDPIWFDEFEPLDTGA